MHVRLFYIYFLLESIRTCSSLGTASAKSLSLARNELCQCPQLTFSTAFQSRLQLCRSSLCHENPSARKTEAPPISLKRQSSGNRAGLQWLRVISQIYHLSDAGSVRTERLFNRSVPVCRTVRIRIVHSGPQLDRDQLIQVTSWTS